MIPSLPRNPAIPCARMMELLPLVLGRAEELYRWGTPPMDAIDNAIDSHRPPVPIELACRVVWSLMIKPLTTDGPAELVVRIDPNGKATPRKGEPC